MAGQLVVGGQDLSFGIEKRSLGGEPTIGVVLATYNGAAYLSDQLECLLKQDIRPHHVVIADDGSTDSTLAIIRDFAQSAPFSTTVFDDQPHLGATKNFLRAAHACSADLLAFCDQDDLWHPNKLRLSRSAFRDPGVMAAIHTYREFQTSPAGDNVRGRLVRVPSRVVDGLQFAPILLWPGMSLVVRREVLEAAMMLRVSWHARFFEIAGQRPLAIEDYWCHMHDALFLNTARLLGSVALMEEALAEHRLHAQNHSQTKKSGAQDARVLNSWGPSRVVPYRKLAHFCADFCGLLAQVGPNVLTPERNRDAQHAYRRWADIWRTRASLHVEEARLGQRMSALLELVKQEAYRGRLDGGLGIRSLAKDGAAVAGVHLE